MTKTREQAIQFIKDNPEKIFEIMADLANDFETEGCEGQGTVSIPEMNKVREVLGWNTLGDDEDDDENDFDDE